MFSAFRFFTALLILAFFCASVSAADISSSRVQLKKIRERIERAEQDLKKNRQSEVLVSRELAVIKKTVQRIDRNIADLTKKQKALGQQVRKQQKVLDQHRLKTRQLNRRIKTRLVALYKEGETGPLKILFSADSPTELVQQYHYLTKILDHDKELLNEYAVVYEVEKKQLKELQSLKEQQDDLLRKGKEERQAAAEGRRLKSRLLSRAQKNSQKIKGELKQLKENSKRLKGLINKLKRQTPSGPPAVANHFAVGRGKLRWPVNGNVVIGFGTQKDAKLGTYYESNGIEIQTRLGSPITAVAAGKVVFSDYFKGYGNLYILSHPGGYHTLYAQTDRMQKKVGENVSAGTVLGYSGLAGRDSIYFEIRSNGSPVNPLSWLHKR